VGPRGDFSTCDLRPCVQAMQAITQVEQLNPLNGTHPQTSCFKAVLQLNTAGVLEPVGTPRPCHKEAADAGPAAHHHTILQPVCRVQAALGISWYGVSCSYASEQKEAQVLQVGGSTSALLQRAGRLHSGMQVTHPFAACGQATACQQTL